MQSLSKMDDQGVYCSSIAKLCYITSSQEELLSRCRFAGEPEPEYNETLSDEIENSIPVESTGIVMLSPPEDENQNDDNAPRNTDVFHTPPEEPNLAASQKRHRTVAAVDNREGETVAGVSKDTGSEPVSADVDLGFLVEGLNETIEIDPGLCSTSVCEIENFRVLKRGSDSKLKSSPLKRYKLVDDYLVLETSEDDLGTRVVDLSPSNCLELHENDPNERINGGEEREASGDSFVKRKIEFCNSGVESDAGDTVVLGFSEGRTEEETEEIQVDDNEKCLHTNPAEVRKVREAKSVDDIDKFSYVPPETGNSLEKQEDVTAKRTLPVSICGNDGHVEEEMVPDGVHSPKNVNEAALTILDVLRMVSEGYTCDPSLANLSILEVAKRRGMTFP